MTSKRDNAPKNDEKSDRYNNPYRNKDLLGHRGENVAIKYLKNQGIQLLARNWRCRFGEIDIIGLQILTDNEDHEPNLTPATGVVIFVEVKTRQSDFDPAFMSRFVYRPRTAVSREKRNRIRSLADLYLRETFEEVSNQYHLDHWAFRFDIVEVLLYEDLFTVIHNPDIFR